LTGRRADSQNPPQGLTSMLSVPTLTLSSNMSVGPSAYSSLPARALFSPPPFLHRIGTVVFPAPRTSSWRSQEHQTQRKFWPPSGSLSKVFPEPSLSSSRRIPIACVWCSPGTRDPFAFHLFFSGVVLPVNPLPPALRVSA